MSDLNDEAPSNAAHWHKVATEAQEHVERLSQYVMQQDMRIANLERDAMRYRFVRTADRVPISAEAARDPSAYDAAIDKEMVKNLPPSCKTRAGCSENGCLGWCDEHKPDVATRCEGCAELRDQLRDLTMQFNHRLDGGGRLDEDSTQSEGAQ